MPMLKLEVQTNQEDGGCEGFCIYGDSIQVEVDHGTYKLAEVCATAVGLSVEEFVASAVLRMFKSLKNMEEREE